MTAVVVDEDRMFEGLSSQLRQRRTNQRFNKYEVGGVKSNLLESLELKVWAGAVEKANKKNPEAASLQMVKKLAKKFGDEDLAKTIIAAKKMAGLELTAGNLEQALLKYWLSKDRTVDDVFRLLQLNRNSGNVIESPEFGTWMSYASKLVKSKGDESLYGTERLMVLTLSAHYGDKGLAKMIIAARQVPGLTLTVGNLEKAHQLVWRSKKKSAEDVFKMLQLHGETSESVLKNPEFKTWLSYANTLDAMSSNMFTATDVLRKKFDEVALLMAFASLAKHSKEGTVKQYATYLQLKLLEKWKFDGVTPAEVASNFSASDVAKNRDIQPFLTSYYNLYNAP